MGIYGKLLVFFQELLWNLHVFLCEFATFYICNYHDIPCIIYLILSFIDMYLLFIDIYFFFIVISLFMGVFSLLAHGDIALLHTL